MLEVKRLIWIDWMKALGMYFIVAGHFFSLYHKYIYIFSVPVFFIISGFLSKRERVHKVFWKKLYYNLVLPMMIICGITYIMHLLDMSKGELYFFDYIYKYPLNLMKGDVNALGRCWFIYSLIVLKIIYQYVPGRIYPMVLVGMVMFYFSYFVNVNPCFIPEADSNAIINACLAFPFFLFGICFRSFKNSLNKSYGIYVEWFILLASILIVVLCGIFNGYVWMYRNVYGENFVLYLIGGVAGACALWVLCKWCAKMFGDNNSIYVMSKGSIIILGFHYYLIELLPKLGQYSVLYAIIDYIVALLILLLFIPVIRICERFFPYLVGKYRN